MMQRTRTDADECAKGQIATEFFVYSGIFLAMVIAAYFTIFFIQSSEVSAKESLYVKWFGENFASHANTAMSGQAGFNYTMKFERQILGKPYAVQFKPATDSKKAFVFITWSWNNATYTYPVANITLLAGECVRTFSPSGEIYYEINTSLASVNFYNDGENVSISQSGC